MAELFYEIMAEAVKRGVVASNRVDATEWFRDTAASFKESAANPDKILHDDKAALLPLTELGKMYLFRYDAKTKDRLAYWDKFPLIFPFDYDATGFWGINMHYLPLDLRAKLMDGLYSLVEEGADNRLELSYEILSSVAKLRYFRPCVKHYLNSHVSSRFLNIPYSQWDIALFLPLERFQKAKKQEVFKNSRRIIKGM